MWMGCSTGVLMLVLSVAGCGRALGHGGGVDSSAWDAVSDLREASASCSGASDAAILAPDTGDGWCGGEISVSGSTPLGPFCPTQIRASVGVINCFGGLAVALADGGGVLSNQMLVLETARYDRARQSWVGTQNVHAYLSSKLSGQPLVFPATVEVTSADDPYTLDAGSSNLGPPVGEVHLRFAMQSSAGLLSGTLVARYCDWNGCLP
jgi:hypothetical protein